MNLSFIINITLTFSSIDDLASTIPSVTYSIPHSRDGYKVVNPTHNDGRKFKGKAYFRLFYLEPHDRKPEALMRKFLARFKPLWLFPRCLMSQIEMV